MSGADIVRRHPRHIAIVALCGGLLLAGRPVVAAAGGAVCGRGAGHLGAAGGDCAVAGADRAAAGRSARRVRAPGGDRRSAVAAYAGSAVVLRGHVVKRERKSFGTARLRVRTTAVRVRGRWRAAGGLVQVRVRRRPVGMSIGDEVRPPGSSRRRVPRRRRRVMRSTCGARGVRVVLHADRLRRTGRRRGGLAGAIDAVRRRAEAGVSAGLGDAQGALARGMVLGADEDIPERMSEDFKRSGLAHLLAVCGQNVTLLAVLAWPLLGALGIPRGPRLWAVVALIALYVPLTGAGPSIVRAGAMGIAGTLAALAGRPASRWYGLLLACAVTLAPGPACVAGRRLAAELRGGGRHLRARAPAGGGVGEAARAAAQRDGVDRRGHAGHRSPDGVPLRAGVACRAAGEPRGAARRRSGDVARHAERGGGAGCDRRRPSLLNARERVLPRARGRRRALGRGAARRGDRRADRLAAGARRWSTRPGGAALWGVARLARTRRAGVHGGALLGGRGWLLRCSASGDARAAPRSSPSRPWTSGRATRRCCRRPTARRCSWTAARRARASPGKLRDHGVRSLDVVVLTHAQEDHQGGLAEVLEAFAVGCCWTAGCRRTVPTTGASCRSRARARSAGARRARGPAVPGRRASCGCGCCPRPRADSDPDTDPNLRATVMTAAYREPRRVPPGRRGERGDRRAGAAGRRRA